MRRRLLASTMLVAFVSVILLGVPLGIVATRWVRDEAQKQADQASTAALAGSGGAQPGHVLADSDTTMEIAEVWLVVGGLAVVAFGAAVGYGSFQASRLGRPLDDLVETAQRLGSEGAAPVNRRYGIREVDQVAGVLDASIERINSMLRAERDLAANASHQLRTPLTALAIRLEGIIATARSPEVREEATAALAAAERLASVVDALLTRHAMSSRRATPELIDLDEILDQQATEWAPVLRRAGRALSVTGERGLKIAADQTALSQTVATLIDNALAHGGGKVNMRTRLMRGAVVIEVSDEGHGVPDVVAPHIFERSFSGTSSTGLGLSLARELIEADGGRLELTRPRPPVFSIFLAPPSDAAAGPA